MGVRKDGITLVDNSGGGGTPVSITSPIGPDVKANSIPITIATDEGSIPVSVTPVANTLASGTLTNPGDFIDIVIPDGFNSVTFTLIPALGTQLILKIGYGAGGFVSILSDVTPRIFDVETGRWLDGSAFISLTADGDRTLSVPVAGIDGNTLNIKCIGRTAGSVDVDIVASQSQAVQNNLTAPELTTALASITDLDIRDLAFATDKVDVTGSSVKITDGVDTADVKVVETGRSNGLVVATDLFSGSLFFAGNVFPIAGVDQVGTLRVAGISGDTLKISIGNGFDTTEGNTADAAVITDVAGTVSGKLRGLVKWAFERMPASLGQKLMSASLPVAIASNQSAIPVSAVGLDIRNLNDDTDSVEASALVSDVPESYTPNDIKPLSLTTEGRLRVEAVTPGNSVWQSLDSSIFKEENLFAQSGW